MIVVDSQGNEYEATYPKRAKGLVKSGRARFVGENKICLACPPSDKLEDNIMSENININVEQKTAELTKEEVWAQIIKLLVGLGLVLAVKEGLKAPLDLLPGEYTGRLVRYFLMVIVAGVVWPLSFRWFAELGIKSKKGE